MKVSLVSNGSDMSIEIKGKIDKDRLAQFSDILDHALLRKSDVEYRKGEECLILGLERNEYEKKKKKILWFNIWVAGKYPTKKCILTIRDIENCNIRDENHKTPQNEIVLIGGIHISDNEIYIGSFCEHENAYGITLKIKKINIVLEDQYNTLKTVSK